MLDLIASLFNGYGSIAMIIFAVGIILLIIEIFIPGFGVFGIMGSIFVVGGMIARFLIDFDIEHLLVMIMFVAVIIGLSVMIMVYSAKNGLLGKSPFIENKTTISKDYSKEDKSLFKLLGKVAFTSTNFKPAGRISINNDVYEAWSYGEYIEKGTKVQIVEVKNNTIYVKRV